MICVHSIKGKDIQHCISGALAQLQRSLLSAVYLPAKEMSRWKRVRGPTVLGAPSKEWFLWSPVHQIPPCWILLQWDCTGGEGEGNSPEMLVGFPSTKCLYTIAGVSTNNLSNKDSFWVVVLYSHCNVYLYILYLKCIYITKELSPWAMM